MTALTEMPAYSHGGPFGAGRPLGVVVHSTEGPNGPSSAEAVAGPGWFGGPAAGTSAHKIVDQNSICEGVQRTVVAWHVGPAGNGYYVGYEFSGMAEWDAATWRQPAQMAMLAIAAPFIADDLRWMGAPARWLSLAQVAGKQKGLLTHNDVRLALGGTTHSDPGPAFPYAELLAMVVAALDGQPIPVNPGPAPAPAPAPVPVVNSSTPFPYPHSEYFGLITGPAASHGGYTPAERAYVKYLQQRLQQLGYAPGSAGWADGVFQQPTADAVAAWQHARMPGTTRFGQVWFDDWAALVNGGGGAPPAPVAPAWPSWVPAGSYFGLITGPAKSLGGASQREKDAVKLIQQQLIRKGFVPGVTNPASGWADGVFQQPTVDAVTRFQRAQMPGTRFFGQVWADDWRKLFS